TKKMKGISCSVRPPPRQQKTGKPGRRLSENQKRVTHRRRAKPFVTSNDILFAGAADVDGFRQRRIRSYVTASLAFGHAHPQKGALFCKGRRRARVVNGGESSWLPFGREFRLHAERRDRRKCHCQRATRAFIDLMPQHHQGCACDMNSWSLLNPRQ